MKFLGLLLILFSELSMANVIELKPLTVVEPNSSLTLMDLIDTGNSSNVEEIQKKLSQTVIVRVQEAGERTELAFQSIAEHLKLVLNSEERKKFKFSIPRRIEILVKSPKLTEDYVANRLIREWESYCQPCKVEVSDLQLPIGKFLQWDLSIPRNIPKGSFNLPIDVKVKGERDRRYWLQGRVDILKEVPVAQRALYIGERVQAEDFKYQWRSITHAVDGAPAKNLILGSQVRVPVSANQVIWSRNLEKEMALKRGDQVRVYSSGGLWELSLSAIAEKDAEIGDTVTLKNPRTNKRLVGQVIGKGEVEVK